jgi:FkbM family methyltransferase
MMENLNEIEITLKNKSKIRFLYPKAEKEMIFSVLQGNDYPLSNVKIKSRNPIILDLGSNFGSSIVYFRDNYPNSTIYGYEPSHDTYAVLEKNVEELSNIHLHNIAVWNKNGKFKLNYGPEKRTGSFTLKKWDEDLGGEYVQTTTIREIVDHHNLESIDILKMDIEAVELDVLFDIFSNPIDFTIHNIFIEYHGEIVLDEIRKTFSALYDIMECNSFTGSQGVVLMVLR